jgi:hypothetical protein
MMLLPIRTGATNHTAACLHSKAKVKSHAVGCLVLLCYFRELSFLSRCAGMSSFGVLNGVGEG